MTISENADLARRYGAAWNAHDVEGLLSMQSDDMTFRLHLEGSEEVRGNEALRDLYAFFFAVMPDYHASIFRSYVCDDLIVLEYEITATLTAEFPFGAEVGQPTGVPMRFEAVDVLPCDGGLVTRKDTYVDGVALRRGLGLGADADAGRPR